MPLSHRRLSAWYLLLAQQLEAGVPLGAALQATRGAGGVAALVATMAEKLEAGGSVDDALRAASRWLPQADLLGLSASAEAGRLPRTLRHLAARHERLGGAQLRVVVAAGYSLAVLHVALLALPAIRMIDWEKGLQWDALRYAGGLALTLGPLWLAIVVLAVLIRRDSPALGRVVRRLPILGRYVRAQALADFTFALGNFLAAGVPIGRAWAAAGLIARTPELQAAAAAMEEVVARGQAPGAQLAAWRCFPPEFVSLYAAGEATGQLEANLEKLTTLSQERAGSALTLATVVYPGLLFAVAAGVAIAMIFSIVAGYLRMIDKLAS